MAESVFSQDSVFRPFCNKVVFSETPEIGPKWHGGVRSSDILIQDGNWNIGGLFALDLTLAGLPWIKSKTDSSGLADNYQLFSIKSRPWRKAFSGNLYSVGAGGKFNSTFFGIKDSSGAYALGPIADHSTEIFVTQSLRYHQKHLFNLSSSFCFDDKNSFTDNAVSWWYIVPGYRLMLGSRWSFDFEYYLTNTLTLPIKLLQFTQDADRMDFYNISRDWYSYMVWGFSYSRKHFRLDLHIASHYSFTGLVLPVIGLGWNF
jgi:hypothetical protein